MDSSSRRMFLATMCGGLGAAAAAAAGYGLFRYLSPQSGSGGAKKVELAEKDIPEGGAKFFDFNGETAVVIRTGGRLTALSAVCTHLGCIVQWQQDKHQFLCPCHAGTYSPEGTVLGGPPPRPLKKIPFSIADGTITVG